MALSPVTRECGTFNTNCVSFEKNCPLSTFQEAKGAMTLSRKQPKFYLYKLNLCICDLGMRDVTRSICSITIGEEMAICNHQRTVFDYNMLRARAFESEQHKTGASKYPNCQE